MRKRESRKELLKYVAETNEQADRMCRINDELQQKCDDLSKRLAEAERKLAEIELFNTTVKEKALPKCESGLCVTCAFCLTQWVDDQRRVVGCRRDIECGDYKPCPQTQFVPIPYSVPEPWGYYHQPTNYYSQLMSRY